MRSLRWIFLAVICLFPMTAALASTVDIPAALEAAGGPDDYPDADVLVVFDHSNIDVEPSGLSHMENHRLVKILTDQGATGASFQRLDYDPATQSITVRRVVVHRADGTAENIDLSGLTDVIAPAHAIYWGARMLGLDLPRLHPGDAVEIETYRKGFQIAYLGETEATFGHSEDESIFIPPMRGHFYDVVLFQATDPIIEKTYTLRTPRAA